MVVGSSRRCEHARVSGPPLCAIAVAALACAAASCGGNVVVDAVPRGAGGGAGTSTSTAGQGGAGAGSSDASSVAAGSTGAGGSCAPPTASCAGHCVDTSGDPANCGSCGHDCQGGACKGGTCQPVTLAVGQPQDVTAIAVDATSVYWSDTISGTVMKVGMGGGTPAPLAAGGDQPAIGADAASSF